MARFSRRIVLLVIDDLYAVERADVHMSETFNAAPKQELCRPLGPTLTPTHPGAEGRARRVLKAWVVAGACACRSVLADCARKSPGYDMNRFCKRF